MNKATRELLEAHFDTAFAAPDGIKKLRELILTLAMQGKLVAQDPNDPPASQLLKNIEAEKKRLVKEGKIKAPKPLPEITPEEVPYALPQGWQWVRLGEIGVWKSGSTPSRTNSKYYGGEIPWVKSGEVKQGRIAQTEESITELALKECSLSLNPKGSVLVAMYGANIGEVGILDIEATTNQAVCACNTFTAFDEKYLLNLIASLKQYFISQGAGAAQPNISREKIVTTLSPLPPLPEQHRIVAKIDELMARCDELEKLRDEREQKRRSVHTAALKQLLDAQAGDSFADAWQFITQHFGELYAVRENVTELRKAILQLAVMGKLSNQVDGDGAAKELLLKVAAERHRLKIRETHSSIKEPEPLGFKIPASWEWRCLNDLIVLGPTNGFSPKAVDYETQVRSLTLTATTSGVFRGENSKFIADDIPLGSDLWLRDGDILVQRGNTLEYVGVPAIYRGAPNCYIYPDLMMKLRISSELDTDYVYFTMSSVPSRDFLRMRASGTSGTMPKINQQALKNLPVPVPPLAEQKRIVSKIKTLMTLCDALEQQIDAATGKQTALLDAVTAQA